MNKYGLALCSFVYSPQRGDYTSRSLESLAETNPYPVDQPILQFTYKGSGFDYQPYLKKLEEKFILQVDKEEDFGIRGLDPAYINSINNMLLLYPEITHIVYMMDDMIYNPDWLQQLDGLIERHPDAKAWTVYRSSYTRHHRVIANVGDDCLVTSIAGVGAMAKKEWEEYNLDGNNGHGFYVTPVDKGGGNTVDLHHAYARPGERWATGRDYWENIGAVGTHSNQAVCIDKALDFVGE